MASCKSEINLKKYPIEQDGLNFYCLVKVAPVFYGFLIGKGGSYLRNIRLTTNTTVTFPKRGESGDIVVKGETYESVDSALVKILDRVDNCRQHNRLTHFFSISANNEELQRNFKSFKDRVLLDCDGDRGISEEIFQKPLKLHLTLFVLVLGDENEIINAVECVKNFREEHDNEFKRSLKIHIKGLDFWGNDPSKVKVLYGKVADSLDRDNVQNLANELQQYLLDKRLISKPENNSIKLHMTLMNISFLKCENRRNLKYFDCSNLIKHCEDWDFGIVQIDEIHLCKMQSENQHQYYTIDGSFEFGKS